MFKELHFKVINLSRFRSLYFHPEKPKLFRYDIFSDKAVKEISIEEAIKTIRELYNGKTNKSRKSKKSSKPLRKRNRGKT